MNYPFSYRIFPLGDSALTLDFGNSITEAINKEVLSLFHSLQQQPFIGMIEAVPAYSSLTVYYDVIALRNSIPHTISVHDWIKEKLEHFLSTAISNDTNIGEKIRIPVCYDDEFGHDMNLVSDKTGLTKEEIIQLHTGKSYRVFMLGFLPGFPYVGKTDKKIFVSRKNDPEMVMAGSVGIAGRQTGIYPMNSPGGWNVIGRTALKLFDLRKNEITLLKPGDIVEFFSISKEEYLQQAYESQNH
jgi:inhibitor of KinA